MRCRTESEEHNSLLFWNGKDTAYTLIELSVKGISKGEDCLGFDWLTDLRVAFKRERRPFDS